MDVRSGILLRVLGTAALAVALPGAAGAASDEASPTPGEDGAPFGPLAVIDAAAGGDLVPSGTLKIDETCVALQQDDAADLTLVWSGDSTKWDGKDGRLRFKDPVLGGVVLADGDRISVGGAPLTATTPTWLQEPQPACPSDQWLVSWIVPDDVAAIRWGPLAVAEDPVVAPEVAIGAGRLSISETCVSHQVGNAEPRTLVWPDGMTRWRPDKQLVVFESPDGRTLRLHDGDRVSLGGAPVAGTGPDPIPGDTQAGTGTPTWVREPAASCPGQQFVITDIEKAR